MPPVQQIIFQIYQWLVRKDPLTIIDAPDNNTTYIGTAPFGTLTSDAKWVVQKITSNCTVTTVGGVVTISNVGGGFSTITQTGTTGGGTSGNVWDNRASLTYVTTVD